MRKISYILLFLFLSFQVAVADVEIEAEKILKAAVGQVFTILAKKDVSMDQKKREVVEITNTSFGFPLMAKLSVGKEHWSQFNTKQRDEFTSLFTGLFQDFYIDKLDLFSDEKVIFQPATVVSKKKVQVPTILLSKGREYSVLYKMANTKNGWKIYDITIEGVSLIHTYRSQYQHVLEGGEVEDLLTKMREKKKENKKL
jgi:phospholipid transport system substrate-binding protein